MTDLAVNRRALENARDAASCQELAGVLGFEPQTHPVNFLADPTSAIHARVSPVASSLYRTGSFSTPTGNVAFWTATLHEDGRARVDRAKARRRIAKALVDLEPAGDRKVLIGLFADGAADIELVLPRKRTDESLGTIRATIDRLNPTRHHLELLSDLAIRPGLNTVAIARRHSDAFNVEKVAKRFYTEFRTLRNRVLEEVYQANPNNRVLNDPANKDEVRRYVTRNLGRVLFLWFLQSKGWLDNDRSFFVNLYESRCRTDSSHNFFRDTLIPLFFEALAKKPGWRSAEAKALGDLPFLNGGLFLQSRFEDELYGEERESLEIILPNTLFDPRQHSPEEPTVLGLLRSYRFTTRESTPDDQSVDPDPELLGKVFENMNEVAERAESGTFYTPREVVHFMCRETLDGYLTQATGCDRETLEWLRQEAVDPEASSRRLSKEERGKLEKALDVVTVCDPAVGSGAFPVGMMHEILLLKRGLEQSADVRVDIGGQRVAEWKEHIITKCLYGVDLNPEAVEICHLRLWLSLVIDANDPVPLPNLDFRFVAGDSLVDRIGTERLLESLPRIGDTMAASPALDQPVQDRLMLGKATLPAPVMQQKLGFGSLGELPKIEAEIRTLREEFTNADMPSKARTLRDRIRKKQVKAVRIQVDADISQVRSSLTSAKKRIAEYERMGAGAKDLKPLRRAVENQEQHLRMLEKIAETLNDRAPSKKPLFWPIEFPEVFEQGGFDIVVANPPYVRQESLSPDDQEAYKATYAEVFSGTADLLVFFYARAVQILREHGHLAFITSNKFHRAGYGEGLRGWLPAQLEIHKIVDFGDLPVFDAIAYPSVLTGRKSRRMEAGWKVLVADLAYPLYRAIRADGSVPSVSTVRGKLEDLDLLVKTHGITNYPQVLLRPKGWNLDDPGLIRLFDRLKGMGIPLGQFVNGQMYYGIKTSLNEAFVIDEETRDSLVADDAKSVEIIKPWLRGKDVKRWKANWANLYLIVLQNSGDADARNAWGNAKSEKEARKIFKSTYPAVYQHLSSYEEYQDPRNPKKKRGLRHRDDQGRFWWELRSCTYYHEFEGPKTVWATLAPEPRFFYDENGFYSNQKSYIAPGLPLWAVSILNSSLFFAVAAGTTLGTKQGGFYEWEKKYMWDLPIVTPPPDIREKLEVLAKGAGHDPVRYEPDIDRVVEDLYGVTREESKLLQMWKERHSLITRVVVKEESDD